MAWQRTGCSHDGGMNVLGQMPIDYSSKGGRAGGGGGGVVGDTTYQKGGGGYTSPREGGAGGNQTDRGQGHGLYGRRQAPAPSNNGPEPLPRGAALDSLPPARYSVDESLTIVLDSMSQRRDRYGNPCGKLGLKDLRKKFILMDDMKEARDEGKAMLNWFEFSTGMQNQQGHVRDPSKVLNKRELVNMFNHCDIDGSGNLDMAEFMFNIINVALPPSCKENVEVVFHAMDEDGSNYIEVKEIKKHYKLWDDPKVKSGQKSEAEAFAEYIASFEPDFLNREENEKDSRISKEEWMDYYCGIFREYAAAYGKNPAINAFNTLIKQTYRDVGKKTKDAFGDGWTYSQMHNTKGAKLEL